MAICRILSKTFIVVIDIFFWALAGGLIFLSAWILTEHGKFGHLSDVLDASLLPAYVLLVLGVVLFALGTIGCIGAIREQKCLVGLYFSLLLIAFVGIVVGMVLAYVYRAKLTDDLRDVVQQGLNHYDNDTVCQKAVDLLQTEMDCCGVDNYTDWLNTKWHTSHPSQPYPLSCCVHSVCNFTLPSYDPNLFTQGCYKAMSKQFHRHINAIFGVISGAAVMILMGLIASCVLMRIRRADGFIYRDLSDTDGMQV